MAAALIIFANLSSVQAGALPGVPVVLLPIGAVEPHGPHAPLGTDTLISLAICDRAARSCDGTDGIQVTTLPPLAYGVTRFSAAFPGSIGISEQTLHAAVSDICAALDEQGYRHRIIVNSHFEPAHVEALRHAADESRSVLFDVTRRRNAEQLGDEFRSGAAHAGRYETSLLLALRPDLVDTDTMRTLPPLPVNMPEAMASGKDSFVAMGMDRAYCGAPAEATAAEGEHTLATLAAMLVHLIHEVVGSS